MNLLYIVLATLLLVAVLTFVGPWVNQKIAEPFQGSSGGCPVLPPSQADFRPPSTDPVTFQKYVDEGRNANNRTAGMLTDTQINTLAGTPNFNDQLAQALTTSMVQPTVPSQLYSDSRPVELVYAEPEANGILDNFRAILGFNTGAGQGPDMKQPYTFFGRKPSYVEESIPGASTFGEDVKTCERVNAFADGSQGSKSTKKNRNELCSALNGTLGATCGVCLKSGTAYTKKAADIGLVGDFVKKLSAFIGGLYISEKDRKRQMAMTPVGRPTTYTPTAGTCEEGYFFVAGQEEACKAAAARLACEEYGNAGGFGTPEKIVTDDGLTPTNLLGKCVACQQDKERYMVSAGGDQPLRVRLVTPTGTGTTVVRYRKGSTGNFGSLQINAGTAVSLPFSMVEPTDVLEFEVYQEFPHRPRGEEEVFFAVGSFTFPDAVAYCRGLAATVATLDQLQEAYRAGAQVCPAGWASDGKAYTIRQFSDFQKGACDISGGVGVRSSDSAGGVWCYGIRPAKSYYTQTTHFAPDIKNWFEYIARTGDELLNDDEKQSKYSRFGNTVDGANYRGILVQLESGTDVLELQTRRRDGAERYIVNVGDTEITDSSYTLERKLREVYSRNGLFENSLKIVAPRPKDLKPAPLLTNQYWLWSTDHRSNLFKFKVEVPGYFRDPEYAEDLAKCPTGILFADGISMARGTPSACENGTGNDACLTELFRKVDGDPVEGDLGPENTANGATNKKILRYRDFVMGNGSFSRLPESSLTLRTPDELETFLQGIADQADGKNMPAKNPQESPDDYNKRILDIITRAQMNLRGVTTMSPCDTLSYNSLTDSYTIVKKAAFTVDTSKPIDAANADIQCLNYLYTNKSTYKSLNGAYSGIDDKDIAASFMRDAFPFQACQPTGTWAPIKADGSVEPAVIEAIKNAAMNFAPSAAPSAAFKPDSAAAVFDSIHKKANGMDTNADEQKKAIEQCYGLVKKELKTTCKGLQSSRVRILPSAYRYNSVPADQCSGAPAAIRFKENGITFRDAAGTCQGTPTYSVEYNRFSTGTFPNYVGGVYVDKTATGAYDVKKSVVTASFGIAKSIQAIDFAIPAIECKESVTGMVFQVLDSSTPPQVMVQKVIPRITDLSNVTLTFNQDDMLPTIPYGSIVTGLQFRLETAIYPDYYFRKADSTSGSFELRLSDESVFEIRDDINGTKRNRVCSIYHIKSNYYLSFDPTSKSILYIPKDDASVTRRSWASWAIQPAFNGSPAHVMLESANYPGQFIVPVKHEGKQSVVSVEPLDFTSQFDMFRACWKLQPAN